MLNARVLAYLAAPALETLHLTLRSDSDSLHTCLRAAGPTLRTLVLCYPRDPPRDMRIGRLMTPPLPTELRALRLCAPCRRVLTTPRLEELVIEIERIDREDDWREGWGRGPCDPRLGPSAFADRPGEITGADNETLAALSSVLETLHAFKTLRIYPT
ncbi:hypothetical protein B0H13DRAFT_2102196 [Mycena leptocephala]|nr:hypothetical protein B0H13DRAFT_2102196 [Mycena leptocephala]